MTSIFSSSAMFLETLIFEIRYLNPLIILERAAVAQLVKRLKASFPTYSFDDEKHLILENKPKNLLGSVELHRAGLSIEVPPPGLKKPTENIDWFLGIGNQFAKAISELHAVEMLQRVGFRVVNSQAFDSLAECISKVELFASIPGGIKNLGLINGFNFTVSLNMDNDTVVRTTIIPGERPMSKINEKDPDKSTAKGLYVVSIDCDVFKEGEISSDSVVEWLSFARDVHVMKIPNTFEQWGQ